VLSSPTKAPNPLRFVSLQFIRCTDTPPLHFPTPRPPFSIMSVTVATLTIARCYCHYLHSLTELLIRPNGSRNHGICCRLPEASHAYVARSVPTCRCVSKRQWLFRHDAIWKAALNSLQTWSFKVPLRAPAKRTNSSTYSGYLYAQYVRNLKDCTLAFFMGIEYKIYRALHWLSLL